jgi:two-component system OmpR family response regulator
MKISKILLVDDDPSIRRITQIGLTGVGKFEVVLASSGTEALDLVISEKPDLILLDVMMPRMDGPATLSKLRELGVLDHVPVIFMTAKVQKQEVEAYLELGACGVVSKPFDPMTLSAQVQEIAQDFPKLSTSSRVACGT